MENKIDQKIDGNNNNQTTIVEQNNYGLNITLSDVKEIAKQAALEVIEDKYKLSNEIAGNRIIKFNDKFLDSLESNLVPLSLFSDPLFIYDFKSAQIQAALTNDEKSYELLSELIKHRASNNGSKIKMTSIREAINVVNSIPDDSLTGLTIVSMINQSIHALSPSLEKAAGILDDLFSKILISNLPSWYKWIEHLEILNVVRFDSFVEFKKFKEILFHLFEGYAQVGIKKGTENFRKASEMQKDKNINLLINNPYLDDYYILGIAYLNDVNDLLISDEQKQTIKRILDLYEKNDCLLNEVKNKLLNYLLNFEYIKKVNDWWDKQNTYFRPTSIGYTIAHVNAKNLYPNFPPLD